MILIKTTFFFFFNFLQLPYYLDLKASCHICENSAPHLLQICDIYVMSYQIIHLIFLCSLLRILILYIKQSQNTVKVENTNGELFLVPGRHSLQPYRLEMSTWEDDRRASD